MFVFVPLQLSSLQSTESPMGNKQSHGGADLEEHGRVSAAGPGGGGADGEDPPVEVPPPMQPISSVPLSSVAATSAEGESKVCGTHLEYSIRFEK